MIPEVVMHRSSARYIVSLGAVMYVGCRQQLGE